MMRKKGGLATLMLSSLFVVAGTEALAEEVVSSSRPPRNLKKVGDHWTPWDPPPAGPEAYIIVKDDTLWDLSGKWLGDPFLWPQVWDENRYILDSHWIYPGDPLVIPGRPTVVPREGPLPGREPEVSERPGGPPGEAARPAVSAPAKLSPLADAFDLYCSGYIEPEHSYSPVWVAGRELERVAVASGDVIYLNQGRNAGIVAGTEMAVIRKTRTLRHPVSGEELGSLIRRLGKVRVLSAQESASTAVIVDSCEDIRESDELVPWRELAVPQVTTMPTFDRYEATASGGPRGYVVGGPDGLSAMGAGHVGFTDMGEASGIRAGDVLTLFRGNGELPRLMLGQAVVLTVEPGTSTMKITRSVREIWVGDEVEAVR